MKKIDLRIMKDDGSVAHAEAEQYNFQWAIHQDEVSKQWVLSHIASGKRVWMAKDKLTVELIVNEPEFFDHVDINDDRTLIPLAEAIKRVIKNLGLSI